MNNDIRATLQRGDEIERAFYELKSQEFGPLATKQELKRCIEAVLDDFKNWRTAHTPRKCIVCGFYGESPDRKPPFRCDACVVRSNGCGSEDLP